MLKRNLFTACLKHLQAPETLIITGARQVGKTTLLRQILAHLQAQGEPAFFANLEDPEYLELLNAHPRNLLRLFDFPEGKRAYVLIDEIQYLDNPTHFLKYLYDEHAAQLKLIVTGSSAFYMDKKFRDSLAGRKRIFHLYTLSLDEFLRFRQRDDLAQIVQAIPYSALRLDDLPLAQQREVSDFIDQYMMFGGYPRVALADSHGDKVAVLQELLFSYTKKDILESGIRNEQNVLRLLQTLAAQTGHLLNVNTLARTLRLSNTAIENYLYILQKSFHVTTIRPFFRNLPKEIRRMPKLYFLDLGLRNMLLKDFRRPEARPDAGALYENFIFRQFLDRLSLEEIQFWRTQQKNEVDFILNGELACEVKFSPENVKLSKYKAFRAAHPNIPLRIIYHTGQPPAISDLEFWRF